jgi:thiol:disulfide interchange protein DsbC
VPDKGRSQQPPEQICSQGLPNYSRKTHGLSGNLRSSCSAAGRDTGINLTRDSLETISLFSAEEMAELRQLTAFSLGSSNKVLYYVTDPQCPYCKRGTETLKKMTDAGEIQVNFLLFPLNSHQGAKEQSVAVICDNKSLDDFEGGYHSDNQCDHGVKIIEKTINLLDQKGITGTPTYIFPDRRYHSGILDEAELRRRLGLGAPAAMGDKPAASNQ